MESNNGKNENHKIKYKQFIYKDSYHNVIDNVGVIGKDGIPKIIPTWESEFVCNECEYKPCELQGWTMVNGGIVKRLN